jgi:hypothetical protein
METIFIFIFLIFFFLNLVKVPQQVLYFFFNFTILFYFILFYFLFFWTSLAHSKSLFLAIFMGLLPLKMSYMVSEFDGPWALKP